ncbi:unnamed protein product [Rotaria socialis]|uniref:AMP deaminase n=1 Tax=Rotaria socialis TaxID=392032 RepID=A0A817YQF2_9BILA|nr:unnamed protein product [Rotaria socialis]
MSTKSTDSNEEITAGIRPTSILSPEWNQQTLFDARNLFHTQFSNDAWQQLHEPQSGKIHKPPVYPNHVLHPEVIPSLNDVSSELSRRSNVHLSDSLALETLETEMPMEIASRFHDELQRAVKNRAAHDRNTGQESVVDLTTNFQNAFRPTKSPEPTDEMNSACEYHHQQSFLTSSLSHDKTSLNEAFQRIKIAGDFHDMSHIEDLEDSVAPLLRALVIREKYMFFSLQSFPPKVANFLSKTLESEDQSRRTSFSVNRPTTGEPELYRPSVIKREDAFNIPLLPSIDICVKPQKGIYCVYMLDEKKEWIPSDYQSVDRDEFMEDYTLLSRMIMDGPLKSFCYRRLQYLKAKFELHGLLNEVKEWTAIRSTPHRDFYNVRKVDTHIHAASSMNQKHLLRFMKKKMKTSGAMQVYKTKDGRIMTLKEVFDELKITAYDLSVDILGVHADRNTFQRFDRFNAKYNPIGQSTLREIFLKTDNFVDGVFFADLLKEVIFDLEESKYQHAEPRLSIYGKSIDEWDKLAKWCVRNTMYSANIVWMVQIPRLYDVYYANGITKNFQEFLANLFQPLFEATIDPASHPDLFRFMYHLTGFDSVDDETKPEKPVITPDMPYPDEWNTKENPPYAYYLFYMYANILTLNQLRKERGLNTYQFRPHCGEAGTVSHLVTAYMVAENISHGLLLRKSPVLQYLFYLCQIGIAMSPLSNNSLFINYNRNPMLEYFERGLCVSLSTDDPMQFHFTKEPLMEEYSIAAQVWKLSSVDMCELARNSVLMSGFSHEVKMYWLGSNYQEPGVVGNDIRRTNVPAIRIAYRYEAFCEELNILSLAYKSRQEVSYQ